MHFEEKILAKMMRVYIFGYKNILLKYTMNIKRLQKLTWDHQNPEETHFTIYYFYIGTISLWYESFHGLIWY